MKTKIYCHFCGSILEEEIHSKKYVESLQKHIKQLESFIKETYDDFESKICKNCKYMKYPKDKTYEGNAMCLKGHCSSTMAVTINGTYYEHQIVEPNFGCNKFKRKSE